MTRLSMGFVVIATAAIVGTPGIYSWNLLKKEKDRTTELQRTLVQLESRMSRPPLSTQAQEVDKPRSVMDDASTGSEANNIAMVGASERNTGSMQFQSRSIDQMTYPDLESELDLEDAEVAALYKLLRARPNQDSEIMTLLGPVKYQKLQEYLPTTFARQSVQSMTSLLTKTPLTAEQYRHLVTSITNEGKRMSDEWMGRSKPADPNAQLAFEEEWINAQERSYDRLFNEARSYLTEDQISAIKPLYDAAIVGSREQLTRKVSDRRQTGP